MKALSFVSGSSLFSTADIDACQQINNRINISILIQFHQMFQMWLEGLFHNMNELMNSITYIPHMKPRGSSPGVYSPVVDSV